jgi:hypothetical protein
MQAEAVKHGLYVRLWLPGTVGTMDWQTKRVNVGVVKAADGKWRVNSDFSIG